MNEQHLITAEFFGSPVSIIDHAGRRWLTAEEVGRCLGYNESTARTGVTNLYNRHADEFTEADSTVIKLMTHGVRNQIDGEPRGGNPNTRIFSGTGCRLLGFFANTPHAKRFRAWAAQTLEAVTPIAEALPAVVHSPRLEASMARMAQSVETLAAGMNTVLIQLDVTKKYIGLLELNQAGTRKVTAEVAKEARLLKAEGMNNADIGRLLRISRTAVSLIVRDKYPAADAPAGTAPKPAGEILEGWIEREQQRLAQALGGAQ